MIGSSRHRLPRGAVAIDEPAHGVEIGDVLQDLRVVDTVVASMPKPMHATSFTGTVLRLAAARLVMSSAGVPSPDSSPRMRTSVPPSTKTIASMPSLLTSVWYAARNGCVPICGNAYTIDGSPLVASHTASARRCCAPGVWR